MNLSFSEQILRESDNPETEIKEVERNDSCDLEFGEEPLVDKIECILESEQSDEEKITPNDDDQTKQSTEIPKLKIKVSLEYSTFSFVIIITS